jgi:hypothetical protein
MNSEPVAASAEPAESHGIVPDRDGRTLEMHTQRQVSPPDVPCRHSTWLSRNLSLPNQPPATRNGDTEFGRPLVRTKAGTRRKKWGSSSHPACRGDTLPWWRLGCTRAALSAASAKAWGKDSAVNQPGLRARAGGTKRPILRARFSMRLGIAPSCHPWLLAKERSSGLELGSD